MNEILEVPLASFDYEALVEMAAAIGVSAEDLALFFISREVVHTPFLAEGGSHPCDAKEA